MACLYCGDGTYLKNPDEVSRKLCAMVNKLKPDVVMCGPCFNYLNYGKMAARIAYDINQNTSSKAIAAMSDDNQETINEYKDKLCIIKTPKKGGIGLNESLEGMCVLAKALYQEKEIEEFKEKILFLGCCLASFLLGGKKMWGIIATWRMAVEGISEASHILQEKGDAGDAIETAIKAVEDFPYYKSVGYGGLPNEEMEVELDAAYMDGNTLSIGAVAAIKDFANPVSIARRLSKEKVNNILVGEGAEKFAHKEGFERKNMLTDRAKIHYRNRVKEVREQEIKPYAGHDTVGMVCLDQQGKMTSATSTSGLFMKKKGRVGDSPIAGSGFYVDSSVGGASATGLGEDLMKGCISYEIVRLMAEGMHPQAACEKAVNQLDHRLKERRGHAGDLSLIAMNNKGEWGVATNIEGFSFAVATENQEPIVYLTKNKDGKCIHEVASQEWLDHYMKTRMAPLEEK